MSVYTTTIRRIVESYGGTDGKLNDKIAKALPHIFDFDFPIFDEEHRIELERKIVLHYFNREIGFETVALWKLYLEERLNLEMPYYNELYATESKKFDYLINLETYTGKVRKENEDTSGSSQDSKNSTNTVDGNDNRVIKDSGTDSVLHQYNSENRESNSANGTVTDTGESNSSTTTTLIDSDYPQATFNKGTDYASGSRQEQGNTVDSSGGTSTSTSSGNSSNVHSGNDTDATTYGKTVNDDNSSHKSVIGTDTGTSSTSGKRNLNGTEDISSYGTTGSKTALMQEYRDSILNIDKMVVLMLGDLFMGVY